MSLIAAAVLIPVTAGHAQSAYDYPWCGVYSSSEGPGGARSCYFATYAQCRATMDRLGYCIRSPYYGAAANDRLRRRAPGDY
jgi:hypothetical protein